MKNGRWLMVLGLLAAAAAGPAAAQDPGLYLGGSAGYVQYKDSCKQLAVPCDDKDTGWRAFGGYQFNRYVGAELGFADLGAATGSGAAGSFKLAVEEAFDLTAVFLFPVSSYLSGLARAGMYRTRTTLDVQATGFPPSHDAHTNSGFSYGAGAELRLGPLGVRAEWQRYENVGGGSIGEDDLDVFSLGLLFRF